ncbi:hypothetical protein ACOMHN_022178 [Nucella lapillus]
MHVQLTMMPRSAGGLPVTRNMPHSQPSMPSQSQPRNMTGIYLGLDTYWRSVTSEGNLKPPRPKTGVPPLARSRGSSSRMRTPTEEQRYRRVELLRIKEEKRGFSGNPVKRHQHPTVHQNEQGINNSNSSGNNNNSGGGGGGGYAPQALTYPAASSSDGADSFHTRRWGPGKRIDPGNLDDLLRPNPRNYTTVANSGVTRSEKLTGWLGGLQAHPPGEREGGGPPGVGGSGGGELSSVGGMAREVGRVTGEDLAGLEECFRKVCKLWTFYPSLTRSCEGVGILPPYISTFYPSLTRSCEGVDILSPYTLPSTHLSHGAVRGWVSCRPTLYLLPISHTEL